MKIVYFASLRQQIGLADEIVAPPPEIDRVAPLIAWLKDRSPAHRAALDGCSRLMVAVNQDYAGQDSAVTADDEVALFPPVTGG